MSEFEENQEGTWGLPDSEPESSEPEPTGFEALPEPTETSDALTAFNNAWSIKLNALREKEQEMERAVRAAAAEDMAKWTQQREIRLKAKKEANRTEEQVFLESLRADPTGNVWEQVVKLIPGDSDADVKKSTNTGKMKSLFIQLKSDPVK